MRGSTSMPVLLALPVVIALTGAAGAQTRSIAIIDERGRGGEVVTRHIYHCAGCTVRRTRAGVWRERPPVVDYRQALPVYQPPIYTHPPHVMPMRPVGPGSAAYPVTGAPARPAMAPRQPYYPSGSAARVITLDGTSPRQRPPRRD